MDHHRNPGPADLDFLAFCSVMLAELLGRGAIDLDAFDRPVAVSIGEPFSVPWKCLGLVGSLWLSGRCRRVGEPGIRGGLHVRVGSSILPDMSEEVSGSIHLDSLFPLPDKVSVEWEPRLWEKNLSRARVAFERALAIQVRLESLALLSIAERSPAAGGPRSDGHMVGFEMRKSQLARAFQHEVRRGLDRAVAAQRELDPDNEDSPFYPCVRLLVEKGKDAGRRAGRWSLQGVLEYIGGLEIIAAKRAERAYETALALSFQVNAGNAVLFDLLPEGIVELDPNTRGRVADQPLPEILSKSLQPRILQLAAAVEEPTSKYKGLCRLTLSIGSARGGDNTEVGPIPAIRIHLGRVLHRLREGVREPVLGDHIHNIEPWGRWRVEVDQYAREDAKAHKIQFIEINMIVACLGSSK